MNTVMTKQNKPQMHHFDVEDAMKYGVEKAVVLSNIRFWLNNNKNKDLSTVKHDGYYWMYNTAKDMSSVLPYFTQSKVQRLLKQLEDDGVLIVGNYNKVKYDRTKWYTLSEFTYDENCSTQTPELNNGNEHIEQPIQDSKTNTKTNNKINTCINIPFSDFWDKYDYCKGKKSDVKAKWISLTDEERALTMESLDKYLLSTPDKTYRKYPMSYLNTEAWNDEHIIPVTPMATTSTSQHSTNTVYSSTTYSPSFKLFEDNSSKHTKDELESNLEALGISSGNTLDTDKDAHNNPTDIVAISSQIHWSELKAKGLLKSNKNPTAIAPNTSKSKEIDDFLSKFSSKSKYNNKNIISGNSVIDNGCIS